MFIGNSEASQILRYGDFVILFFMGSILGFLIEGLWSIVRTGLWENHSALVWGPFCIIYGFGAAAMYLLSYLLRNAPLPLQFLCFAVGGSVIEYIGSFIQEWIFGSISWDYSNHFMNVNGRISLQMAIAWGILGIGFSKLLYPLLQKAFSRIEGGYTGTFCIFLSIFMLANVLVSSAAVLRWRERTNGKPAGNSVEHYIDRRFNDERMHRIYKNMRFVR